MDTSTNPIFFGQLPIDRHSLHHVMWLWGLLCRQNQKTVFPLDPWPCVTGLQRKTKTPISRHMGLFHGFNLSKIDFFCSWMHTTQWKGGWCWQAVAAAISLLDPQLVSPQTARFKWSVKLQTVSMKYYIDVGWTYLWKVLSHSDNIDYWIKITNCFGVRMLKFAYFCNSG